MYDDINNDINAIKEHCRQNGNTSYDEATIYELLENFYPLHGSVIATQMVIEMLDIESLRTYVDSPVANSDISSKHLFSDDSNSIFEVEVPQKIHPCIDLTENSESNEEPIIEDNFNIEIDTDFNVEENYSSSSDNNSIIFVDSVGQNNFIAEASEMLEENNNDPNNNLDDVTFEGDAIGAFLNGNEDSNGSLHNSLNNVNNMHEIIDPIPGCSKDSESKVNLTMLRSLPNANRSLSPLPGCSKDFNNLDNPVISNSFDQTVHEDSLCIQEIVPWAKLDLIYSILLKHSNSSKRKQLTLWDLMSQESNPNTSTLKRKQVTDSCSLPIKSSKHNLTGNAEFNELSEDSQGSSTSKNIACLKNLNKGSFSNPNSVDNSQSIKDNNVNCFLTNDEDTELNPPVKESFNFSLPTSVVDPYNTVDCPIKKIKNETVVSGLFEKNDKDYNHTLSANNFLKKQSINKSSVLLNGDLNTKNISDDKPSSVSTVKQEIEETGNSFATQEQRNNQNDSTNPTINNVRVVNDIYKNVQKTSTPKANLIKKATLKVNSNSQPNYNTILQNTFRQQRSQVKDRNTIIQTAEKPASVVNIKQEIEKARSNWFFTQEYRNNQKNKDNLNANNIAVNDIHKNMDDSTAPKAKIAKQAKSKFNPNPQPNKTAITLPNAAHKELRMQYEAMRNLYERPPVPPRIVIQPPKLQVLTPHLPVALQTQVINSPNIRPAKFIYKSKEESSNINHNFRHGNFGIPNNKVQVNKGVQLNNNSGYSLKINKSAPTATVTSASITKSTTNVMPIKNTIKKEPIIDNIVPIHVPEKETPNDKLLTTRGEQPSTSNQVPDRFIYNKLRSMFPEVKASYIKNICKVTPNIGEIKDRDQMLNALIDHLLTVGINHLQPVSVKLKQQEMKTALSIDEQYEALLDIFPNADPTYLRGFVEDGNRKNEDLEEFIQRNLESRNYPTKDQYLAKIKITEQLKQYTTDFKVEKFLEIFPEPFKYFENPNRKCEHSVVAMEFLKSYFNRHRVCLITATYVTNKHNLSITVNELMKRDPDLVNKRKNSEILTQNIPLLQEIAFIKHKKEIINHVKSIKESEENMFKYLQENNMLITCQCCFNDECMPSKCVGCSDGHMACYDCIIRGTNVALANGMAQISCFTECKNEFSLATLQKALPPTTFSALLKKRQAAEVIAAEVEGLVSCPFCHFASIPPPEDKVFKCLNPDCMKETCRQCKELNHVPLRCDELIKSENARKLIEEKMTEALIRTCYKCKRQFVKEDGCNKMTCHCGALMCYVCNKPVDSYKHFNAQGDKNFHLCPLWTDDKRMDVESVRKVAQEITNNMLQKNPNLKINIDELLPTLPPKSKGPHEQIINAYQIPEHVKRVVQNS